MGLLHDATRAAHHPFFRATLIYAENGRGKTTLASMLRSCATGDVRPIINRQTLDSTRVPEVELLFDDGTCTFNGSVWSACRPQLSIFDADFVEKNVYSGAVIRPEHRQNLLEFALGVQAVQLRQQVDTATQKISTYTQAISAHGYPGPARIKPRPKIYGIKCSQQFIFVTR